MENSNVNTEHILNSTVTSPFCGHQEAAVMTESGQNSCSIKLETYSEIEINPWAYPNGHVLALRSKKNLIPAQGDSILTQGPFKGKNFKFHHADPTAGQRKVMELGG